MRAVWQASALYLQGDSFVPTPYQLNTCVAASSDFALRRNPNMKRRRSLVGTALVRGWWVGYTHGGGAIINGEWREGEINDAARRVATFFERWNFLIETYLRARRENSPPQKKNLYRPFAAVFLLEYDGLNPILPFLGGRSDAARRVVIQMPPAS